FRREHFELAVDGRFPFGTAYLTKLFEQPEFAPGGEQARALVLHSYLAILPVRERRLLLAAQVLLITRERRQIAALHRSRGKRQLFRLTPRVLDFGQS